VEEKEQLYYDVIGEGKHVLLLHGFLESREMWRDLIASLGGFKYIVVDLPGHGLSNGLTSCPWKLSNFTETVISVLKSEKIDAVDIIGHSLGGYVALDLLKKQSFFCINNLILLNSHPWADSNIKKRERTKAADVVLKNKSLFLKVAIPNLYVNPNDYSQEIESLLKDALMMDANSIVQTMFAMRDRDSSVEAFVSFGKLIKVIQGEKDGLIPAEKMEALCGEHNVAYNCLFNVGHMAHQEAGKQVAKLVENWLK
jgi:pimeloyl-ACP methyl ester carboxylesterase